MDDFEVIGQLFEIEIFPMTIILNLNFSNLKMTCEIKSSNSAEFVLSIRL